MSNRRRTHARTTLATALAGAAAIGLLVQAQQAVPAPAPATTPAAPAQAPPTFRGGANFVYVDVYPRADGRVVDGLRAQDFQVFEDGKPQAVETFELIKFDALTPDAERRDPNTPEEGVKAVQDPRNRVYVIYLDYYHTSVVGSHQAKPAVNEFLRRAIGPGDVFAVMTPEMPVQALTFGRRAETIQQEMEKYWTWGLESRNAQPRTETERIIANNCMGTSADPVPTERIIQLYREDLLMTNLEHLMAALRDLRDERKNILFLTEGWTSRGPQEDLLKYAKSDRPQMGTGPGGRIGTNTTPSGEAYADQSICSGLIIRLAGIDFDKRFRDFLSIARRANVSFYPIDVGGLKVSLASADATRSNAEAMAYEAAAPGRLDLIRTLAENTDGLAVLETNDLAAGARKIADTQSSYYLLGYYSTNANFDGRFRRIEVKLAKPGISVSARPGYLAPTADEYKRFTTPSVQSDLAAQVGRAMQQLGVLRPDAELYADGVMTAEGLDIVAELPARLAGDSRWTAGADLDVSVTGANATVAAKGRMDAGARAVRVKVPLSASGPGPWQVRVRAANGASAPLEARLDVRRAVQGKWLGAPRLFRGTPSPRIPARPTADREFRRTERLLVEVPIAAGAPETRVQLLDRRGQTLPVGAAITDVRRAADNTWVITLAVAALADGDYVLQLSAGTGAERDERMVAFRVVR